MCIPFPRASGLDIWTLPSIPSPLGQTVQATRRFEGSKSPGCATAPKIIETWGFKKTRLSSLVTPASPRGWIVRSRSSGLPIDRHCRAAEPAAAAVILYDNSRYRSGRPQQEQRE
jgi:hypothetical protein